MSSSAEILCKKIVSREKYDLLEQKIRTRKMSRIQREAQLVSFVWGNAPEGDKGTFESVRENLDLQVEE